MSKGISSAFECIAEATGLKAPKEPKDVKRARQEAERLKQQEEKRLAAERTKERHRRRARMGGNFGRRALVYDAPGDETLGT